LASNLKIANGMIGQDSLDISSLFIASGYVESNFV
jgi:hypothetical protein